MARLDVVVVLLQCYFVLMNATVERYYCHGPLADGDPRFLVQATVDFCRQYNPLFLRREEWMRKATCVSAYCFWPGYALVAVAAATGAYERLAAPLLVFIGAKLYALLFYHFMEFTSETPPTALVPYLAVEGPYLFSIAVVLSRVAASSRKRKAA